MRETPVLFERFPCLRGKIPWSAMGALPTPVQKLDKLGAATGLKNLYCKRDDLSHPEYGGNKIRKLEFLLADAKRLSRKSVLTLGGWGSNHVLATTVLSNKLGIRPVAVMVPQCAQEYARSNLLTNFALGCELHYARGIPAAAVKISRIYLGRRLKGDRPYFIWAGGSSALGALGYVDAGLEIAGQVRQGLLPEPDLLFCAVGSCGTFSGLVTGLKLAGLKTRVIGVRVYDKTFANSFIARRLAQNALKLLRSHDPSVPALNFSASDFTVLHDFAGSKYAVATRKGSRALHLARDLEGIQLDCAYTAKTLSAIIALAEKGELKNQVVLFLDSFNSRPVEKLAPETPAWEKLPRQFHRCFTGKIPEPNE